jgi:hypothetical protein
VSESNGQHANPRAIAFEHRGDDGRPELVRMVPHPGCLGFAGGGWWISGRLIGGGIGTFRLDRIATFFGLPDEPPPSRRCLCGAIKPECACPKGATV